MIDLREEGALQPAVTGGKAAALARAVRAGIDAAARASCSPPTSPQAVDHGQRVPGHPAVHEAFGRAGGDHQSLVARSSSVVEDTAESSMAGQFDSVIGIEGLEEFTSSVQIVLDSRARAGAPSIRSRCSCSR